MPARIEVRQRLKRKMDVQFPASLAASEEESTGKEAILNERTARVILFSRGALTVTTPLDRAGAELLISAPTTFRWEEPGTSFSAEPKTSSFSYAPLATSRALKASVSGAGVPTFSMDKAK